MRYKIFENGIEINVIVADAAFVESYCEKHGYTCELVELPEADPRTEEQIAALKATLSSTDYKIIKCSEAQLVGEPLPYDIAVLHSDRQALRDTINELQGWGEDA